MKVIIINTNLNPNNIKPNEEYKFKIVPQFERYYNDVSYYGVYVFLTDDDIPQYQEYKEELLFDDGASIKKMGLLCGNMQQLYIGSEYEVVAKLEFNKKYNSWQYVPKIITAIVPQSIEQQKKFLQSILTERQANVLLEQYPNIVEDVINKKDNVDLQKLNGIGEKTWNKIKEQIISNYIISDILILLQPLGVSFRMIKKLINEEPNPVLLKQKLLDNPYIMTKIKGFGFKTVDALALKLNPKLRVSFQRTYAFLDYYFKQIGNDLGHTWVFEKNLDSAIRNNINECFNIYQELIQKEKANEEFLHFDKDKVGLKSYYDVEINTFEILKTLNLYESSKKINIDIGIEKAEQEQGFKFTEEQREIIKNAVNDNVVLITGRAGTGKSSIARALLNIYKSNGYSIAATAFSAKAAQRIIEATGFQASTIHRLLKVTENGKFNFNHQNPLPYDVVFLDEASMVNAQMFYALVSAIKEGSKIIICGDNKQLPPIGYGNVFSDLLQKKDVFNINQLTHVHRQAEKSGVLVSANKIREGISPIKSPTLKQVIGENHDMAFMFRDNRETLRKIAIKTYLKLIKQDGLDNTVIITPRRQKCINSTQEINKIIQDILIPTESLQEGQWISYGNKIFKLGAKIIQRENNYEKNVFNGETGYITKIWEELDDNGKNKIRNFEVKFKLNDDIKIVRYTQDEIKQIDLAYAITTHVSQGSGFNTVIVIIDNTHYTLLDTCMLYTALTRAKKRCLLLAEPSAYKKCITNNKNIKRQTWLGCMN